MDYKDKKYHWWVPPSEDSLRESQIKVRNKFEQWKKNPFFWQWALWFCFLLPLLFIVVLGISFFQVKEKSLEIFISLFFGIFQFFITILLMVFGLFGGFVLHAKRVQADLVKLVLADQFGWKYSPQEDRLRWHHAYLQFHEVFRRGNANRYVHDQFWGNVNDVPFWAGDFHYVIRSGYGEYKHDNRFNEHFFAIKLPRAVSGELHLKSKNLFSKKYYRWFKRDIHVESIDFNKVFRVIYRGEKSIAQKELLHLISPGLQARIIEINARFGDFDVLVKNNMVICMFKHSMLKNMKTSFLRKGFRLDPEDSIALERRMTILLDIMSELSRCVR